MAVITRPQSTVPAFAFLFLMRHPAFFVVSTTAPLVILDMVSALIRTHTLMGSAIFPYRDWRAFHLGRCL